MLAPDVLYPCSFSPDGQSIIFWEPSEKGAWINIKSLDVLSGRSLNSVSVNQLEGTSFWGQGGEGGSCSAPDAECVISPDGKWGAIGLLKEGDKAYYSPRAKGMQKPFVGDGVLLFDAQTGKHLTHLPETSLPKDSQLGGFSDDSRTLIIAGTGDCQLRDSQTGRLISSCHDKRIIGNCSWIERSSDVTWLIYFDRDNEILVWDAATGHILREFRGSNGIIDCALSPDNRTLAVSTGDGTVQLYRMR